VHLPVIFKVLSLLSAIVSLSMVLPLGWSLWDGSSDGKAFLLSISAGLIFSAVLFMAGKNADYNDIGVKDGFLVVSLSWIFASLIGALPFYISGTIPTFAGAFFESASGFTTTGASVLSDIEAVPRGILFWRSLTHWLGGMGIIVLSLAILPFLGVGGMELFKAEVPGPIPEKITPRIQQTALYLWGVYAFLTVAETVLLLLGGMNLFESLTHTFGTVATGGFSPLNRSVGQYGSAYFDWIITVFMFLSGINFVLHYRLLRGHFRPLARDDEFRTYLWIVLFCIAVISADLLFRGNYDSIAEALRYSAFQVVSIITTTGFATADFELWPSFTQLILLLLMFAGACAGSTGGGMKILRLLILSRHTRAELKRVLHPHAVISVKVERKHPFHAHTARNLAYGEGFAQAAMFPGDHDSFKNLYAFPCTFLDLHVHPYRISRTKIGDIIFQVFLFHETDNVHFRILLAPFHNSILIFQRHPKKRSSTIPAAVLTER
jgi:trk system potassium uptake protein TrkH